MTLGLIHTVQATLNIMNTVCYDIIPEIDMINLLDEGFLSFIKKKDFDRQRAQNRIIEHILCLEEDKADVILIVCNSLSALVDEVNKKVEVPLIKIDEEMIKTAVRYGGKVGILANHELAAQMTKKQMEAYATSIGVKPDYKLFVEPRALSARKRGNINEHNRLILERIKEEQGEVDILVLAQVSLSLALDGVDTTMYHIPILTSPRPAIKRCRELFRKMDESHASS